MNRFILTVAFTVAALAMSTNEASAFFRKKKASAPQAQTVSYSAPVNCCDMTHPSTTGYGMPYQSNMGYSQPYQSNMGYGQPYQSNMGYGSSNSNGVLGAVSNLGENVIDTTGRVLTAPFRAFR